MKIMGVIALMILTDVFESLAYSQNYQTKVIGWNVASGGEQLSRSTPVIKTSDALLKQFNK